MKNCIGSINSDSNNYGYMNLEELSTESLLHFRGHSSESYN